MIEIKKITALETYPIRLEVLRKNIPMPYEFSGDLAIDTFHLGAFKNNELIAISSFMKVNNKNFKGEQYQLRGMATIAKYQGYGAGKMMMQKAFSILTILKMDCLWCNARIIAVNFYKNQGLKTFGKLFSIEHIGDHYVMFKDLNNE
ncbi:MAG: GNAT family N-acetyltransferase [Lutibacter sp.]|nr:MAG: GNAT family N-acetyltransferase [Lutibacter sp.]